jgi:hypothetical protein
MATDLGKVGMIMKGTWNSSVPYEELDVVSYNNGTYIAKQAVPANTAPSDTNYWQAAIDTSAYPKQTMDLSSYLASGLSVQEYIRVTEISKNVMLLDVGGLYLTQGLQNVFADFPYTIYSRLICQMSHDGAVSTQDSAMLWSNNVNAPSNIVNANCSAAGYYWGQCVFTVGDH